MKISVFAALAVATAAMPASAAVIDLSTLIGTWHIQNQVMNPGDFYDDSYIATSAIILKFTDFYVWGDEYEIFVNGVSAGLALAPMPPAPDNPDPESAFTSGLFTHGTLTLAAGDTVAFTAYTIPAGYGDGTIAVSAALVPEPATWGLMIAGFGLVGAAVRRRTALTA